MSAKHLVLASIEKAAPHYMASSREAIYEQLVRDGHVAPDNGGAVRAAAASDQIAALFAAQAATKDLVQRGVVMTPMQAAAAHPNNKVLLRQVRAACARIGYDLRDDSKVDSIKLTECMKTSGASIESRMGLREALHALHLIEH
jgi:hypothetical protein